MAILRLYTRYGSLGASSRLRLLQYKPWLAAVFSDVNCRNFFDDCDLLHLYEGRRRKLSRLLSCYIRRVADTVMKSGCVWIEKEILPFAPASAERHLLATSKPIALDFDDATFHTYDLNRSRAIRSFLGRKIDRLMERAHLVTVGNSYLAERATIGGLQECTDSADGDRSGKISPACGSRRLG